MNKVDVWLKILPLPLATFKACYTQKTVVDIRHRDRHQSALAFENFTNTSLQTLLRMALALHHRIHWQEPIRIGKNALLLRNLLDIFTVPSTGTEGAKQAFKYLAGSFEDTLQISAAVTAKADHILAKMPPVSLASSFPKASLQVLQSRLSMQLTPQGRWPLRRGLKRFGKPLRCIH